MLQEKNVVFSEVLENFKKIFLVDPFNQIAWFNQGVFYYNNEDYENAM